MDYTDAMKRTILLLLTLLFVLQGCAFGFGEAKSEFEKVITSAEGAIAGENSAEAGKNAEAGNAANEATTNVSAPATLTKLATLLPPMLQTYTGDYAVYVLNPKTNAAFTYNNHSMPSASMIKMFILGKAYEEIAAGKLSEGEVIYLKSSDKVGGAGNIQGYSTGTALSIKTLLHEMITESDNVATNLLIRRLGMDNINAYIQANGYTETKLQRQMMDFEAVRQGRENFTSVRDLGAIFTKIYNHQCVNPELDEKMIATLKQQTDTEKLVQGLPAGTVFAHKTGI